MPEYSYPEILELIKLAESNWPDLIYIRSCLMGDSLHYKPDQIGKALALVIEKKFKIDNGIS